MSPPQLAPGSCKDALLSRRQIEGLIADGRIIIIVDGKVLKVDPWLKYHSGGDKAIMHMVGRDATDEARRRMESYQIGRIEGQWRKFPPPIQGGEFRRYDKKEGWVAQDDGMETSSSNQTSSLASSPLFDAVDRITAVDGRRGSSTTYELILSHPRPPSRPLMITEKASNQSSHIWMHSLKRNRPRPRQIPTSRPRHTDQIVQKYREVDDRIRAEGLYNAIATTPPTSIELTRYCILFSLSLLYLKAGWYGSNGLFLGPFWHQLVFTAHDARHMGITHRFTTDTVIGIVIADFLGGLDLGWWKRNHNVHHFVTNAPEHDPDIAHLPFFAVSHRFLASLRSTYHDRLMPYDPLAHYAFRVQHHTYHPVLALGRFNLYRLSWSYLLRGLGPRHGIARWHR